MSQFDVHSLSPEGALVVDCQADVLAHLSTRFVVPLVRASDAPETDLRLRPRFIIAGEQFVMATPFASSIPRRELGPVVASLALENYRVIGAIDVLVTGI